MNVAFIPARGGSIRVPGKNLSQIGEESLVDRAVRRAMAAECDRVVVSTDDEAIAAEAYCWKVEVHRRKPEHATDDASIEDALADWIADEDLASSDRIAILQPTSCFVSPSTVRECLRRCGDHPAVACIDVSEHWAFSGHGVARDMARFQHVSARVRTQDIPPRVRLRETGGAYAFTVDHWRGTGLRMATVSHAVVRSWVELWDIDTDHDLMVARALYGAGITA